MPDAPPRLHLLRLTCTEYDRVTEWARRFTNPGEATTVRLARSNSGRRWICAEENVVGTLEIECDDPDEDAALAFLDALGADHFDVPERLLAVLPSSLPADAEEIVLGYDPQAGTLELVDGLHRLSMSHVDAGPTPAWIDADASDVVHIDPGPVISLFARSPVGRDDDRMPPFVRVVLRGTHIEFSRDLTPWGLGVERVGMEADDHHRRELSFHAPTAMVHLSGLCDPMFVVQMAFFSFRPLLVRFAQDDWTLWVLGGHRSTTTERPRVVNALTGAGWAVENDPSAGTTATLAARRGGDRVVVTLLPVLGDSAAVVRLKCTVAERVPWSDALAREIADLNAAWPGEKVLHRDGRLLVAREVNSADIGGIGRLIDDLVSRARALTDVVGVFL